MKKLLIVFTIFIFSVDVFSQTKYNTYGNARFSYSIAYPADLLIPQGEADNGDGQIFKGEDAALTVFGSNMLLNETLLKEFNSVIKERGASNVTYKTYRSNFFVVSGKVDGKIFYRKVIKKPNGIYISFTFEYDEAKSRIYNRVTAKISKSFK